MNQYNVLKERKRIPRKRLGALGFVSNMVESNKTSVYRAHKLFQLLIKLEMFNIEDSYDKVENVYSAFKYAEKYEPKKK